ncbi:MAG: hypothetical protein FJ215_07035 [Ignavibacteria bacterium]|nr:hypothetical protein [Ignavibacteria bacterium]
MGSDDEYPRALSPQERDLLFWVLPPDRPGYRRYREAVESLEVMGEGRRGSGNNMLAPPGIRIDCESPLPHVIAYGIVEAEDATIAVSVREFLGAQLEFEIMNLSGAAVPKTFTEIRRWSLSDWYPGLVCPICSQKLRETGVASDETRKVVLAICAADKRIWLYDGETGINHLVPVTSFYNELMLHRRIRDPEIALHPERLFADLDRYTDRDLVHAFYNYNRLRMKVRLEMIDPGTTERETSFMKRVLSILSRRTS